MREITGRGRCRAWGIA
ncbi:helix-turn-helix domain-containing protein [Mesorhizobium sp. M1A.F.Ca.IN.022.04.1.1]|nr:hypothetical protein EOA91_05980 [Mesorhizobium sp. M1A.F.Ca.IN.022.04.1.1]RWG26959.1 MAG: hypothetical protein EOQ60_26470 [Mesorhizobium sp.]TIS16940.1 MAG: hypothetical protein E5X10_05645 [Mesorhizobium sp.]